MPVRIYTLIFLLSAKFTFFVSVPFKHTKRLGPYVVLKKSRKKKYLGPGGRGRKVSSFLQLRDQTWNNKDQSYNCISSLSSLDSLHLHGTEKETQLFLICLLLR